MLMAGQDPPYTFEVLRMAGLDPPYAMLGCSSSWGRRSGAKLRSTGARYPRCAPRSTRTAGTLRRNHDDVAEIPAIVISSESVPQKPAIDRDAFAGDVTRRRQAQERDRGGDLLWFADAPHRRAQQHLVEVVRVGQ